MPYTGAASDKPGDAHRVKHTTNTKRTLGDRPVTGHAPVRLEERVSCGSLTGALG